MVVPPLYVFDPVIVQLPVPVLRTAVVPSVPSLILPENVVFLLFPPTE